MILNRELSIVFSDQDIRWRTRQTRARRAAKYGLKPCLDKLFREILHPVDQKRAACMLSGNANRMS
jgi:hypothetical protein